MEIGNLEINSVIVTSAVQVLGDVVCVILALACAIFSKRENRIFFSINTLAFFLIALGDIHYNYTYRILHENIDSSVGLIGWTSTMFCFQLAQAYNWGMLIRQKKQDILSPYNLPYLLFTIIVISVLIYYFLTGYHPSVSITWYQIASISLDMVIWLFAIICLSRARSLSIILLTLGSLMIISADLTSRTLFMSDISAVASMQSYHIIWAVGVLFMACGFGVSLRIKEFNLCPPDSIQTSCCAWLSITSLVVFVIGFTFLSFFSFTNASQSIDMRLTLWSFPIVLVFTMITAVLLGNWFSNVILIPINHFLKRIEAFNLGLEVESEDSSAIKLSEFKMLGTFINSSFRKLSSKLDSEIKIAAQVAHDIRSPLAALQVIVEQLPELEESQRILIRDAIYHIRDITNNLEKNAFPKKIAITQIAILLEHVLSERRAAFSDQRIKINQSLQVEDYSLFVSVIPSEIKRVLTNVINNACEAISPHNEGEVNVSLTRQAGDIIITITDNGAGIPKELTYSLFTRGFTTKQKGSGLGLFHAKESLAQWGGNIELNSEVNKGTIIQIKLPAQNPPHWFVSSLSFVKDSTIICVDDSISIWQAWQERLKSTKGKVDLHYCSSKEALVDEIQKNSKKPCTYLVDYEFSGKSYTGLDLINQILALKKHNDRAFLVTSRSGEDELQIFCSEKKIYMIPKFFALKIPLRILLNSPKTIIISSSTLIKNTEIGDKTTLVYKTMNDFLADLSLLDKSNKIFIDEEIYEDQHIAILKENGFNFVIFNNLDFLTTLPK